MGTSTSYTAPTSGRWSWAKRIAGQFSAQGGVGGSITLNALASAYLGALGGASNAAQTALAGQSAARSLGAFLAGVNGQGLTPTLEGFGLTNLVGQDTNAVLMGLVDYLAGANNTIEEAIARTAMEEVLFNEFEQAQTYDEFDALLTRSLDRAAMLQIFSKFLAEYIYQRMVGELGARIESGAINPAVAHKIEQDLRAFIFERVKLEQAHNDLLTIDWHGPAGQNLVNQLFKESYEQLETE